MAKGVPVIEYSEIKKSMYKKIPGVSVYLFNTGEYRNRMDEFYSMLSPDEIHRANRFGLTDHKTCYIICRGMLRWALGLVMNIPPDRLSFTYNSYGKPGLVTEQNRNNIHFNLSHAGDYGLIALASKVEIGADLELIRPMVNIPHLVERFFTPPEKEIFKSIQSRKRRHEAFFRWWVQKEAVLKALGRGISRGFADFDLDFLKFRYCINLKDETARLHTHVSHGNLIFCICLIPAG